MRHVDTIRISLCIYTCIELTYRIIYEQQFADFSIVRHGQERAMRCHKK